MHYRNLSFLSLLLSLSLLISCGDTASAEEPAADEETPTEEATGPNQLTAAEREEGWTLLFDGTSVDQWRGYNKEAFPDKGWSVVDGEIHVFKTGTEEEGYGGDIITKDTYEDFDFSVDFMLSDTSNSGILYLVKEEADTPIWHNAPEFQLLDDATYVEMGVVTPAQLTGSNYDMHAAPENYMNPIGEWNTARVRKEGAHVEHWLNGNKVIEYDLWTPEWEALVAQSKFKDYPGYGRAKVGHIGLQDHGHLVRFRNIKIREL
jgi:hypothetical protein